MQLTLATLALLASSALVVAKPAGLRHPEPDCTTTSTCSAVYSTRANIITDPITVTSTSTRWDTSYITESTPTPVVHSDFVTTTSTSMSYWDVTTSVKVPVTTSRVITIPVHTFTYSESCTQASSELYPVSVHTNYYTNTSMIINVLTTSTPCYDPYPVTTYSARTEILTDTTTSCSTYTTDPPKSTGWGKN